MKYTQQELEGMGDLELNFTASVLASNEGSVSISEGSVFIYQGFESGSQVYNRVDYCDNWSDCGALIDECGIIADGSGSAMSVLYGNYNHIVNCEVKRAVTIVYILIKQDA